MNLKIITLNIAGGLYLDKCLMFFKKANPDILLLQEVYSSPTQDLLGSINSVLNHGYVSYAPAYSTTKLEIKTQMGNAVISKFPIIQEKSIFYDVPYISNYKEPKNNFELVPRNLQYCEIATPQTNLNLYNTHGIWSKDSKDTKARLNMSKVIIDQVLGKKHCILGGDFNITPNTQTIDNIEKVLTNISKNTAQSTFNTRIKTAAVFSKLIVDMLFISKDVEVFNVTIPNINISDHLPVVSQLKI